MDDKIALFDMDGTIADYHSRMREDLSKLNIGKIPEKLHDSLPSWLEAQKNLISSQPGWWVRLLEIQSGIGIMNLCKDIGFGIHILTQGPRNKPLAWGEKLQWCEEHVKKVDPEYTLSITRGGKGLHYGRVFVDDWPPFMESWLKHRHRGLGLMPITAENEGFTHPQVLRYSIDNWHSSELEDRLRFAYDRKSKEFA